MKKWGDSWIFVSQFQKFDCGESKSHSGLNLVLGLCTDHQLPILQTIFISAAINVDFIPSFIQKL